MNFFGPEIRSQVIITTNGYINPHNILDIIENLVNASLLPAFDVFMIEWHKMKGYKERLHHMINAFKENNFKVLTIGNLDSGTGMIYCIHSN